MADPAAPSDSYVPVHHLLSSTLAFGNSQIENSGQVANFKQTSFMLDLEGSFPKRTGLGGADG